MEIISLNRKALTHAVSVLRRGGVIVYPTETAYGLGCDATNVRAVKRIFLIKGRVATKPLPLIAGSRAMAERYIEMPPRLRILARQHWPGPLTIVTRARNQEIKKSHWIALVSGGTKTLGVRVSGSLFARALSRKFGRPIVATSANRARRGECYTLLDVFQQLNSQQLPDLCIDGGALRKRKPSTVVAEKDGKIVVLRKGPIRIKSKFQSPNFKML